MVTETDSGSPLPRLSVLRNKAENIKNRSNTLTQLTEADTYRTSQIIILAISELCLCLIIEKYRKAL